MRILFDHNTPAPLRSSLQSHIVETTGERGWESLANGKLLDAAEGAEFEVLITADKRFFYQQNLAHRRLRIVILSRGN